MLSLQQLIVILLTLITGVSLAQEQDKALLKSNDLVFDGNKLVGEDFVAAEKEYRKAISEKPNNTSGTYNLGNAYYNSELYSEALLRHLETAKSATSKIDKHQAYHNIGNALMKQKQCKEAVEAFKNALRNDPTDEETRYNLVIAKECAEQQGGGDDEKEDEDKEDESKDKGEDEEDKKEGDDKEDEDGKPKDEKGDNKGDPKEEKKNQKPQPGKLSPQQVKNLLEAMNNQEKKVQDKINAKKVKGEKVKTEKDW